MKIYMLSIMFDKNGDSVYRGATPDIEILKWHKYTRQGREQAREGYRVVKIVMDNFGSTELCDYPGHLIFSNRAILVVGDMLKEAGDFYALDCTGIGMEYMLYNCWTYMDDAVDKVGSTFFVSPNFTRIKFKTNARLPDVFKIHRQSHLFVSEKFKQAAETAGLIGMEFIEVRSNEK